jgi:hypothetical protein
MELVPMTYAEVRTALGEAKAVQGLSPRRSSEPPPALGEAKGRARAASRTSMRLCNSTSLQPHTHTALQLHNRTTVLIYHNTMQFCGCKVVRLQNNAYLCSATTNYYT